MYLPNTMGEKPVGFVTHLNVTGAKPRFLNVLGHLEYLEDQHPPVQKDT